MDAAAAFASVFAARRMIVRGREIHNLEQSWVTSGQTDQDTAIPPFGSCQMPLDVLENDLVTLAIVSKSSVFLSYRFQDSRRVKCQVFFSESPFVLVQRIVL
jgi:hypothetical protein